MSGGVAWGMTPAYRQLPSSDEMWYSVQAGKTTTTLHDALAHSNPQLRLAYTRLLLYSGVDPNAKDVKGRFGRSPADCIVAHPPSQICLKIAAVLKLFGANFMTAKAGLMPPIEMAAWMHNTGLKQMLTEATNAHPLAMAAKNHVPFHDALAAVLLGNTKRSGAGPLPKEYQDLQRPWHPSQSHLFPSAFNTRVHTMFFALRRNLPAEMALLVCTFVDPDAGPFVDKCVVPKAIFDSWCYVCSV